MPRYRQWILSLGLLAVTPGIVTAGPLSLFKTQPKKPAAQTPAKPPPAFAKSSNQKTAEKIAGVLREAKLNGYDIQIEFKNGVATLTGMIADRKQQAKAEQVVDRVPGVKKVKNKLKLLPEQNQPVAQAKPAKTDTASKGSRRGLFKKPVVQTAAFQEDGKRKPGRIVQVGEVQPGPALMPAQADPRAANQMRAIRNNQEIAEKIAAALKSARLNGRNIEVHYQNGVAKLGGLIGDAQQKARATQVVRQVPGVRAVENRLTTMQQTAASAATPTPIRLAAAGPMPGGPMPGGPRPIAVMRGPNGPVPVTYQQAPPAPALQNGAAPPMGGPGPAMPGIGAPPSYGHPGGGAAHTVYDMPHLPNHAWPSYASYPNSAQISYPQQYSASAWPYIGPFYPYPQIPLGWRKVQLEWDDGYWNLNFNPRTDKWFWFMNPKYW